MSQQVDGDIRVILFLVAMDAEAKPIVDTLRLSPNDAPLCAFLMLDL
jgi:hypothetical protein